MDNHLTVANCQKGGVLHDHTLCCLGALPGPLLLMLSSHLATTLRQELDNHAEVRVGWQAVADGALLALFLWGGCGGHPWDALIPHLDGPRTNVTATPEHPAQSGTTSSRPSTAMECTRPTRGGQSGRRRSSETTGAVSVPACWIFETPFAGAGLTSGSVGSAAGPRPFTSRTPAVSAGHATQCPPPCPQVPTGAHGAT